MVGDIATTRMRSPRLSQYVLANPILSMLIMDVVERETAARGIEKGALKRTGRTFFVP